MAGFISGHGDQNDDLTTRPSSGGGGGFIDPTKEDRWSVGYGQTFDRDVDRSRERGAQGQAAVQLNQGPADESRTLQMGSLGMLRRAAQGDAPSRAAALGQASTENAIRSGMAGVAGARGPGAGVAAMRAAQMGAGQQMGAANGQLIDMRAGEMAHAQQGFASAVQGVRGQDTQAAVTNAQLEAQQRALNEQHQQANERMAWDTRHAQLQGTNEYVNQQSDADLNRKRQAAAQRAADWSQVTSNANMAVGTVTGGLGAIATSNKGK